MHAAERSPSIQDVSSSAVSGGGAVRKLSVPNISGSGSGEISVLKEPGNGSSELPLPRPSVREGLVRGYGGAIEKTLADEAASKVKLRQKRLPTGLAVVSETPAKEGLSRRESKVLDGSVEGMMIDSGLIGFWFMACGTNNVDKLLALIANEPRLVRIRQPGSGWTALHWAARNGNSDLVRSLVHEFESNTKALSRAGYTPLHVAAVHNKPDIMAVLVTECGADPDMVDYSGKTAAHYLAIASNSGAMPKSTNGSFHKKPKTLTHSLGSTMKRVGSFNARMRSSVMRRFTTSQVNMKESVSSPGFHLEETSSDVSLMPPPAFTQPLPKKALKHKSPVGLVRRESFTSEVSRSDSVISMDDTRSVSSEKTGRLFDSESDTASFHGSTSDFADVFKVEGLPPSAGSLSTTPTSGKTSSPVVYAKTLSSHDSGSVV